MALTKRKAIRECKKLWKEIEKSGLGKDYFLETLAGKKWKDKKCRHDCPLCEYGIQKSDSIDKCKFCPLYTQYGKSCYDLGYLEYSRSAPEWFEVVRGLKG